ncbi:hypothetical protein EJ110_NYTH47029 [Nymphaea thermarum]|nr:hypothetical protein EJ110_NYTH47029 [Nymphaea thermarum]
MRIKGPPQCEALLLPGFNCKVRIEKNASKSNHKSKKSLFQNNSVYICQFCAHKNLKPGSLKGYLKSLTASKLVFKSGSGAKIVNKTYVSNVILPGTPKSNLPDVASVSPDKMLLSAKRD